MNFSFTRFSLFLAICLVFVSTAMAATTCPSQPPSTVNYSAYNPGPVDNGAGSINCATDNLSFSLFGFFGSSNGGAIAPTPSSIGVTVVDPTTTPGADGPGFNFNPGLSVGPGGAQDAEISFKVTAAAGSYINDLFIGFNGAVSNPANGASSSYSEEYCTGGWNTNCNIFQVNDPPPNLTQLITIPNATTLYITKDFGVSGGNGSASISLVTNEFSTIPEPREIGLLILAMVGLVFAHRRIKASVN